MPKKSARGTDPTGRDRDEAESDLPGISDALLATPAPREIEKSRHSRQPLPRRTILGPRRVARRREVRRVSAPEIERAVSAAASDLLGDHSAIAQALEESGTNAHRLPSVLESARTSLEVRSGTPSIEFRRARFCERNSFISKARSTIC